MAGKKLERLKQLEKEASSFFAEHKELGTQEQTKITLFLEGLRSSNALSLFKVELTPIVKKEWPGYRFLHSQFFREIELGILLLKGTNWTLNPFVYLKAARLNTSFAMKSKIHRFLLGGFSPNRKFIEYLALSHAIMTVVSFIRLLPPDRPIEDPFWLAVQEIEKNNEVQQQVQVRLLKDTEKKLLSVPLNEGDKDEIVDKYRRIVEEHFSNFLEFLINK